MSGRSVFPSSRTFQSSDQLRYALRHGVPNMVDSMPRSTKNGDPLKGLKKLTLRKLRCAVCEEIKFRTEHGGLVNRKASLLFVLSMSTNF